MRDIISAGGVCRCLSWLKAQWHWMDGSGAVRAPTVRGAVCSLIKLYLSPCTYCTAGCSKQGWLKWWVFVIFFLTYFFLLLSLLSHCPCHSFSVFLLLFFNHIHLLNAVVALTFPLLFIHVIRFNAQARPCQFPDKVFFSFKPFYVFVPLLLVSYLSCFFCLFRFFYTHVFLLV